MNTKLKNFIIESLIFIIGIFGFIQVAKAVSPTQTALGGTGTSSTPALFQLLEGTGVGPQYSYRPTSSPTVVPCINWRTSTFGSWASACLEDITSSVTPFQDLLVNGNFQTWNATNSIPVAWDYIVTGFGGSVTDGGVVQNKNTTDCNDASSCVQQVITGSSNGVPTVAILSQTIAYDPTKLYGGNFEIKRPNNDQANFNLSCASVTNFDLNTLFAGSQPAYAAYWDFTNHVTSSNFDSYYPNGFNCSTDPSTNWQTVSVPFEITGDFVSSSINFYIANSKGDPVGGTETVLTDNAHFGIATSTVTTGTKQFVFDVPNSQFPYRFKTAQANFDQGVSSTGYIFASSTNNTGKLLQIVDSIGHISPVATSSIFTDLWNTDGTNIWRLTGNVGIGTSTLAYKLSVVGATRIYNNLNVDGDILGNNFGDLGIFQNTNSSTGSGIILGSTDLDNYINPSGKYRILTGNYPAFYLDGASGKVGIGTITPTTILHVVGNFTNGASDNVVSSTYGAILSGESSQVTGPDAAVLSGFNNLASGPDSLAQGDLSQATAQNAIAMGFIARATAQFATAIGTEVRATATSSMAFGSNIRVNAKNSIGIGLSDTTIFNANQANTFTVIGGNVGFGTSTPDRALVVDGEFKSTATSTASCFTTDGVNCVGARSYITTTTASIGGGLITAASCTTPVTSTLIGAVVGSGANCVPADGSLQEAGTICQSSVVTTNVVSTQVCAIAAVTPTAKTYKVTIFP